MLFAWLKIGLFAAVLSAPVLGLALLGPVEPYGNIATLPDFPAVKQVLRGKRGALDQVTDATLARSAVRKASIALKNSVSADVIQFVDTPEIVSGTGDWLFLKAELWSKCQREAHMRPAVADLDLIIDLGRAAEMDVVVSISPDKATIYPENLHPLASRYWHCKAASSALLRRILGEEAPQIIDHAMPIREEKARQPGAKLYFHTDTHWTPLGSALALRQLLARIFPYADPPPAPRLSGEMAPTRADLGNQMLLLTKVENAELLDPRPEEALSQLNSDPADHRTVILGDSFYGSLRSRFEKIFPALTHLSLENEQKLAAPIATADRLIVNSVERSFPGRARRGALSSSGAMARAILARNSERAKQCEEFSAAEISRNSPGKALVALQGFTFGQQACLQVEFETAAVGSALLRFSHPETGVFGSGRAVPIRITPGQRIATLVVPDRYAGAQVSIEHPDSMTLVGASIGFMIEPTMSSGRLGADVHVP